MDERIQTLTQYLGDMHALERHMLEAFEFQIALTKEQPDANKLAQRLTDTCNEHIAALQTRINALGDPSKSISDALKTAVSGIFGIAAGVVNALRTQRISKAMRDSYTALSLANISYVMLQTTSLALNDKESAALAEKHLRDGLGNAQAIANLIPDLVVRELSDDELEVNSQAAAKVAHLAIDLSASKPALQ